jgi:Ribbon-helix-helix protein, copG family
MTTYAECMTVMVSFRADEEDVAAADRWAERLGVERSELLRDALASHIARLAAEADAAAYEAEPFTLDELALDDVDDWGPTEDWSDWAAWADRRDRAEG